MADLTSNELCNICNKHYCAGLRCCALGSTIDGGRLIYKQGSVAWIVAPSGSEVGRNWYCVNHAITRAEAVTGVSGGWFVPSVTELLLGFSNRQYWDVYSSSFYFSSSCQQSIGTCGWGVNMRFGSQSCSLAKLTSYCVRAFRKVFY